MKEQIMQRDNMNFIKNQFGKDLWIQVYGHQNMNGADGLFWTGLIPSEKVEEILKTTRWEHQIGSISPGFTVYGDKNIVYDRTSGNEYEPLLFVRDFSGVKNSYIEVSEEFRLLNNLYYDYNENKYFHILDSGELDLVIKQEQDNVYIKLSYLKRFAAVKQVAIVLYFDIKCTADQTLEELALEPVSEEYFGSDCCFDYNLRNYKATNMKSCSIISGKKLLFGVDIEKCGYWPYDKEKKYEEYIIGVDEDGTEINYNSNPDKLSSYFEKNPTTPNYLTPIYFSKDVLTKYYSKPEFYEVNDGHIRCQGLWLLNIDNSSKDYVSAYLGDLGRDIPNKEQLYWKSFNIVPDGTLSETKFKRDFLAQFANPELSDLKFKQIFIKFKNKWSEEFDWELFLELSDKDKYNFEHLRIPVSKSQVEFDGLVLSLVKTLIDSLNEKALNKVITNKDDLRGSISLIERFLEEQKISQYEQHIQFLRKLQNLRSTGSGHRKGKGYEKTSKEFGLEDGNFIYVFENILKDAILFIEFLEKSFFKSSH